MLREKAIAVAAIVMLGVLLIGQLHDAATRPDDSVHRKGGAKSQGCPACHEIGPALERS